MERIACEKELKGASSNQGHVLVLDAKRWDGILWHLRKSAEEQHLKDLQKQYQEYLRDGSRSMVKQWEKVKPPIKNNTNEQNNKKIEIIDTHKELKQQRLNVTVNDKNICKQRCPGPDESNEGNCVKQNDQNCPDNGL